MAAIGPSGEYEDDAARIDREYIPDTATTERDVQRALKDAGFPEKAQSAIQSWLVDESDAWDVVGPQTQDADSVQRELDRATNGTVDPGRAANISEDVGSTINQARAQAAQRVTDNGMARGENGTFVGKLQNVEEEVRSDGIYFRNTDSGKTVRAARFDR